MLLFHVPCTFYTLSPCLVTLSFPPFIFIFIFYNCLLVGPLISTGNERNKRRRATPLVLSLLENPLQVLYSVTRYKANFLRKVPLLTSLLPRLLTFCEGSL
ncbi:hypothetical protein, unlikely [Trypanosoma brucei brucei TREU927]|uniref:Uncharacterized protein n=1 Tax=Trypanosoma brucei brucei (strain 927/4 GUTat10.1) TaxID=185431 RepID=Q4GYQ4_TRYB2|nr:hypothetical protein, unlikely [Trypanosoma brucei brucei TREU927]CAJ16530.1 hypothetical protein, unlikely [Trypanosoma brucei brucei TREU927]